MNPWRILGGLWLAVATITPLPAADEPAAPPAAAESATRRFGPFEALVFDATVLQDVKFERNRIYLKRQPDHRTEAITLRASQARGDAYRLWHHGEYELVSPANAGHPPNGWTDWVETTAPFVEYWMEGRLILHLHRIEP